MRQGIEINKELLFRNSQDDGRIKLRFIGNKLYIHSSYFSEDRREYSRHFLLSNDEFELLTQYLELNKKTFDNINSIYFFLFDHMMNLELIRKYFKSAKFITSSYIENYEIHRTTYFSTENELKLFKKQDSRVYGIIISIDRIDYISAKSNFRFLEFSDSLHFSWIDLFGAQSTFSCISESFNFEEGYVIDRERREKKYKDLIDSIINLSKIYNFPDSYINELNRLKYETDGRNM